LDRIRFAGICKEVTEKRSVKTGIGTLGEKTLHAVLKRYFEPYEKNHEVSIGGYVADIVGENGIIEIQTGSFDKIRKKLDLFLSVAQVTVVYPVAYSKWIVRYGDETRKRKSPKTGSPYEAFRELYRIKQHLRHDNLKICIIMLDIMEYNDPDSRNTGRTKGSPGKDRVPADIREELYIECLRDYNKLVPESLPQLFTSEHFRKAAGTSIRNARMALNILSFTGALERVGKQGNAYLYKRTAEI